MSSFAAASTSPVTNKVAHAKNRTSLRILVMTVPPAHGPMHRRRARAGRRHDGDTSNLAQSARRLVGSSTNEFFSGDCVPLRFLSPNLESVIIRFCQRGSLNVRLASTATELLLPRRVAMCPFQAHALQQQPHSYSITLSARASNSGEMLRPSALAALRLMIRSNLVGCSIGSSPGLAPLRILCT